ncbi:MAG: ubiquitin-conjugating enzyme E2 J1 [Lasallia pustulata]|uniref:Ubiquitin-conjugating enzyme E2 J1 n=1 Tax=Lasallia pustulata TaxID=136370 RepID=A0A5M8PNP7_9LECA|nr:MAG: ubiquitin-conjugating enzyme E2 J1 [Lasallia pustulata]
MSTHGQFNTKSPTIKRILKEAHELSTHPSATLHASPLPTNLFEWHFTLAGPPSSPYSTGIYHGRILLPPTYPLRPPSFRFLTPSGRFETNREICLSISGHHEESWQPAWGVRTALLAIRSFMREEAGGQVGGLEMGVEGRRRLAGRVGSGGVGGGGRRNEEILSGEEGAGGREGGSRLEETVPEGLRVGYRDELGKKEEGEPGTEKPLPPAAVDPVSPSARTATAPPTAGRPAAAHPLPAAHSSNPNPSASNPSPLPLPRPPPPSSPPTPTFSPPTYIPLLRRPPHPHHPSASATPTPRAAAWRNRDGGAGLGG